MAAQGWELVEVTARELRPRDRDGSLMPGRQIVATRPLPGGRVELLMEWERTGKPDRATPEAHRTFRVMRKVAGVGMPLRHRARARVTGGTVEVWDAEHPESPIAPGQIKGHRWAMRCEHGTTVGRRTEREAREDVVDPRLWCVDCVAPSSGQVALPL